MAYQALYRKYRPVTFSDVVGQDPITRTLKNELAAGKVFHAYLFTGTRGTGKTSCAKILAKAVNCLSPVNGDPCGECESCRAIAEGSNTDIAEIDAASNNGVDDIRSLRDQINYAPADSKYRVYIIDEVHMLSESAFNALLKTLEEPPEHVVFILATTEVHKLPATILSRCQRFDFHRIEADCICRRLREIAEKEHFTVSDEATRLIAVAADGGMRDALSLLDLCSAASSDITEETVTRVCGMAGKEYLVQLADAVLKSDAQACLALLDRLYNDSVDMLRLLNELTEHYRNLMIVKTCKNNKVPIVCSADHFEQLQRQAAEYRLADLLGILRRLSEAGVQMQSGNRRLQMEIVLIRLCLKEEAEAPVSRPATAISHPTSAPVSAEAPASTASAAIPADPEMPTEAIGVSAPPKASGDPEKIIPFRAWREVLSLLAVSCPPTIGILNDSKAYLKGEFLLIDAPNPLFRQMINANSQLRVSIKKALEQVAGRSYRLGPYRPGESAEPVRKDPLEILNDRMQS